jgi:hypothetical protein
MAVYRATPRCAFCGEPVAKAINRPGTENLIGDAFSHWQYFDCQCKEAKEWRKTTKSNRSDLAKIIFGQETDKESFDKIFPSFKKKIVPGSSVVPLEKKIFKRIKDLLGYNNVDYINDKEILECAKSIMKLIKNDKNKGNL